MTIGEIQCALRALHRENLGSGVSLREARRQKTQSDSDWPAIIAVMEDRGVKGFMPAPGRAALRLASFSMAEQEQIQVYCQRLIDEAHALCMRFQDSRPTLRDGDRDVDALYRFERWYRAQLHAMERLRRRCDGAKWIRAHMVKARRWVTGPQMESVN